MRESADGGEEESVGERMDGIESEGAKECKGNGDELSLLIQTQR